MRKEEGRRGETERSHVTNGGWVSWEGRGGGHVVFGRFLQRTQFVRNSNSKTFIQSYKK